MNEYALANIPARIYNSSKKDLDSRNLEFFRFLNGVNEERAYEYCRLLALGNGLNFFGNSSQCLDVYYAYFCKLIDIGVPCISLSIFDIVRIFEGKEEILAEQLRRSVVIGISDFYLESYDRNNPLKSYDRYTIQNFIQETIGAGKCFAIFSTADPVPVPVWDKVLVQYLNEYNYKVVWE